MSTLGAEDRLDGVLLGIVLAIQARARAERLVDDEEIVAQRVRARLGAIAPGARVHRGERVPDVVAERGKAARLEWRQAHGRADRQEEPGGDNLRGTNLALLRVVQVPTRVVRALAQVAAVGARISVLVSLHVGPLEITLEAVDGALEKRALAANALRESLLEGVTDAEGHVWVLRHAPVRGAQAWREFESRGRGDGGAMAC